MPTMARVLAVSVVVALSCMNAGCASGHAQPKALVATPSTSTSPVTTSVTVLNDTSAVAVARCTLCVAKPIRLAPGQSGVIAMPVGGADRLLVESTGHDGCLIGPSRGGSTGFPPATLNVRVSAALPCPFP